MVLAKITAVLGLAFFVGGATGGLATTGQALGAVLLLVAAAIGAVALEARDPEVAAGLVPSRVDETDPTDAVRGAAADNIARPSPHRLVA